MIQAKATLPKGLPYVSAQLRAFVREKTTEQRTVDLVVHEETPTTAVFELWLYGSWSFVLEGFETSPDTTQLIAILENPNWFDMWDFPFRPVWDELLIAIGAQVETNEATPEEVTPKLSDRESEVYECVRAGLERKEIAEKLNISRKTVDVHLNSISSKFNFSEQEIKGNGIRALRRFINQKVSREYREKDRE